MNLQLIKFKSNSKILPINFSLNNKIIIGINKEEINPRMINKIFSS